MFPANLQLAPRTAPAAELMVLHDLYLNDSRKAPGYYLDFMATAKIEDNRELYLRCSALASWLNEALTAA